VKIPKRQILVTAVQTKILIVRLRQYAWFAQPNLRNRNTVVLNFVDALFTGQFGCHIQRLFH